MEMEIDSPSYEIINSYFTNSFKTMWKGKDVQLYQVKFEESNLITTLSNLVHPNISQFFGSFIKEGKLFFILEDTTATLSSILLDSTIDISWINRLQVIYGIAKGIDFLHKNKIVHGNLKSSNILVDSQWNPKITNILVNYSKNDSKFSHSIRWTAPEHLENTNSQKSTSSDIFSFGFVIWEILARKIPFENLKDEEEVAKWILNGKREEILPNWETQISQVIKECWKTNLLDRPDSSKILDQISRIQMKELSFYYSFKEEEEDEPIGGRIEYEKGRKLWESGVTTAILHFLEAAMKGNKNAYLRLDQSTIETSLRKEFTSKVAQHRSWYERQARSGDPHALYNMALCYEMGYGAQPDRDRALEIYKKCGEKGYIRGYYAAGNVYRDMKNFKEAVKYYKLAEAHGILLAYTSLGYSYEMGNGVDKNERLGVEYYMKAAEGGEANAQYNIAVCYQLGQGIGKDLQKAVFWYQKSADIGIPEACYYLGILYETGTGIPKDKIKAKALFQKAADRGLAKAWAHL